MVTEKAISRELMGKIVDEVFDGAIEDASVIEEIYACIKRHEAALSTDAEPVKPLHENDAIWARFYRDGKKLGEICSEFKCGVYDLSPWLTAPLARSALSAQVQDVAGSKPLDLNITKEWFEKRVALEGDHEIGAGSRKLTASIDPTPDELAELYRIAHRIPGGWQLVPKEPTEEMKRAGRKEAADCDSAYGSSIFSCAEIFSAMLAAAPAIELEEKP